MAKKKPRRELPSLEELASEDLSALSFPQLLIYLFGKSPELSTQSKEALKAYQTAEDALCKSEADKAKLSNAVGEAMDIAIKASKTPLAEMTSMAFAVLAKRGHRETDGMKEEVFAWLDKQDNNYPTPWSAAKAVMAANLVKLKFKTILSYVQEYRARKSGESRN